MSLSMIKEFITVFDVIAQSPQVRVVIIKGSEGYFCAGADIKDMAQARATQISTEQQETPEDPIYQLNRSFGDLMLTISNAPQTVITLLEGVILGGGFGLACVSDIAFTLADAIFGLPETSLGIVPAQIAPFVVQRIGLTQARHLALLGSRINGTQAHQLGITHYLANDVTSMEQQLDHVLQQIKRCGPQANARTKALLLQVNQIPMTDLLDYAAKSFTQAIRSPEGQEGTLAFIEKRPPTWNQS